MKYFVAFRGRSPVSDRERELGRDVALLLILGVALGGVVVFRPTAATLGVALTLLAAGVVVAAVRVARAPGVPDALDAPLLDESEKDDPTGARDADFVALGLGPTNMMAMIWTVAMGRRAVGVEMRGDPSLGVHWNLREELYHHLAIADEMMLERYGEDGIPKLNDGRLFRLAEVFYTPETQPGAVSADEVITRFDDIGHIAGRIDHTEFIDDRWRDGAPNRSVLVLDSPPAPTEIDYSVLDRRVLEVLDGPSTFQCGASEVLVLLRRYLEAIEALDRETGREPRVRLFTNHRVVATSDDVEGYLRWLRSDEGFVDQGDGRKGIRIEKLRELDYRGKFRRVRLPGSEVLDLGVPELFMVAQGFDSADAARLGFTQKQVKVDHQDGRGEVVAQADYLAGLLQVLVDGRLRRRIASVFDREGTEYWVRQLAVGHEDDPMVGWILVQVPDFKTFDPILAGLVPKGTPRNSAQYKAAHNLLLRDYYLEQASLVLEIPKEELAQVQLPYGPKLFSLVEVIGEDALVARNGVVAGDSFGNGHFLTSGGVMTGIVGHSLRVLQYWQARAAGETHEAAIRTLADRIEQDTKDWLAVSATEFSQASPVNFGAKNIAAIQKATGRDRSERAATIDATRRHRHTLAPLNPSDWRRINMHRGRTHAFDLPPISEAHPELRMSDRAELEASATDRPAPGSATEPVPDDAMAGTAPMDDTVTGDVSLPVSSV